MIGRRFGLDLLGAILPEGPAVATQGLVRLTESGLVYADPASQGECEFMHALMQLAAYESMLKRDRNEMHARVATSIDNVFPDLAERQPALVARHLTEAQQWGPAAARWLLAGGRSLTRSANLEAVAQLREGLALLVHLPPGEAEPLELALLSTIGPALIATQGFGSAAVGETYARARELCESMGSRPDIFPSMWGTWVVDLVRGKLRSARQHARHMLDMAQAANSDAMLVEAWWTLGDSYFWLGDLPQAQRCLEEACAIYDVQRHGVNALMYGQDPGVAAECYRAYCLWLQGWPDQSNAALKRARALAEQRNHLFSTAWALAFEHALHASRREPQAALAAADRTLAFCTEHGTPFWIAAAQVVRGWAATLLGDVEPGLAQLRQGLALYNAIGSLVMQPVLQALLADALMAAGRDAEAAEVIESGLALAQQTEERIGETELHLARGDLARRQHPEDTGAAEAAYQQALAMARDCGAASLALRAATRLHPLMALAGRSDSSPLPGLFAAFTEGHDTPDWQAAEAALAALPVTSPVAQ